MRTTGADGITCTISPSADYTTFENNTSRFTFNCSGSGTQLFWTVDGYAATTSYVHNKGIYYTPPVSPDGLTVTSQLIVPTTKANNNTVVFCTVLNTSTYYHQSSDPVRLILQGTCTVHAHCCMLFGIIIITIISNNMYVQYSVHVQFF